MAWCHVGHKDGMFAGVISHDSGARDQKAKDKWKREVAKFCGDYIASGIEIKTCNSREEYLAFIAGLREWKEPRELSAKSQQQPSLPFGDK